MSRGQRQAADVAAGVVALIVLIVGFALVIRNTDVEVPTRVTTVTKQAVEAPLATTKRTVVVTRMARRRAQRTVTTESAPAAAQPKQVTTTREDGERTFIERALGDEGLIFIKLAIVAVAAFLSGALVQRAILGEYAVRLGSFELAAVAGTSAEAIEAVRAEFERALAAQAASTARDLSVAYSRLALLERQLPPPPAGQG